MSIWSQIRPPAQTAARRRSWLFGQTDPRAAVLASLPIVGAGLCLLVGLALLASALSDPVHPAVIQSAAIPTAANDSKIDINTATAAELATLPGIGERRARAMVELREQRPFASLADLVHRGVIKTNELQALAPLIAAYVLAD